MAMQGANKPGPEPAGGRQGLIPSMFKHDRNRYLVNYNSEDVIAGTGIVTLYPGFVQSVSGSFMHSNPPSFSGCGVMSDQQFYSDIVMCYTANENVVNGTQVLSQDFDVTLNLPTTYRGIAKVMVPIGVGVTSIAGQYTEMHAMALLSRVRNNVATSFASAQGSIKQFQATQASIHDISAIYINVPLTTFKRGDILRLTIQLWVDNTSNGNAYIYQFGADPFSRLYTYAELALGTKYQFNTGEISQLTLQMPVRIDI